MTDLGKGTLSALLSNFCQEAYDNSKAHGFWEGPENDNVPTKIALMHSELSELLEAYRKSNPPCDKKTSEPLTSMEEEVADLFIRLADFCGRYAIDLGKVVFIKHEYNIGRPYKHGSKVV
jgi:NTP pyrophosphatase (non-canonical NTP hydrolase)